MVPRSRVVLYKKPTAGDTGFEATVWLQLNLKETVNESLTRLEEAVGKDLKKSKENVIRSQRKVKSYYLVLQSLAKLSHVVM